MSRLPRILVLLLRLLPTDFRTQHREEMEDLFREYVAGRGVWSRTAIWARAAVDVLLVAVSLRTRGAGRSRIGRARHPTKRSIVDAAIQDIRYCIRSFRRDASLALFATLIIALGLGATSTVFSVASALLLRPLPFHDPDRLVWISNGDWGRGQRLSSLSVQVAHLVDLREGARSFVDVAGYYLFDRPGDHTLTGTGTPERVTRLQVTENFFPLLGVQPSIGRLFTPEEVAAGAAGSRDRSSGAPRAILLDHGFWQRRFAGDATMVGRSITLDDTPAIVVGVLPASFDFTTIFAPGSRIDFVEPFPLNERTNRRGNTLALIGRLRGESTLDAAETEARALAAREHADRRNSFNPRIRPLREHVSGDFRFATYVLIGAVALVMLIVCANLSNLLVARGATRQKEIAIRAALGADRPRLIRQMLTESTVLASIGAVLGLLLAVAGTRLVSRADVSIPLLERVRVDGAALAFTVAAAVITGIVFGVAPAVRASAIALHDALKEGNRTHSAGGKMGRMRDVLVVSEVALACVLLIGAGLLVRSFVGLVNVDMGFEPQRAVVLRIDPGTRFETAERRAAYYAEALRRLQSAPGVDAAGLTDVLPMAFNRRWCVRVPGRPTPENGDCTAPYIRVVSDGYFRAMGLTLVTGRSFVPRDDPGGRRVVIVNELLAQALWPGEDPLRRAVRADTIREVVGVVRGMRHLALDQEPGPELFLPMRQSRDYRAVHAIARGARSLADLTGAVRGALVPLNPNLPVNDVREIQDIIDHSVSPRRFVVLLLAGFAGFALVLASLGIYAVISYAVSQRTQEIGIRIALGASAGELQRRILLQTLRLAGAGMVVGLLAAWMLGRAMEGLLFGVTASDPLTFALVPLLLLSVAALAGYLPARRASRVDPVQALGAEPRGAVAR